MQKHEPLLLIRLEGEAIGAGRVAVDHLLRLLTSMNKAFLRCGQVLEGGADSLRRGPRRKALKDEIALELVQLTPGSPATVLGFERHQTQQKLFDDFGLKVIEKAIAGLEEVQKPGETLPAGYDTGVLMAWREVGVLFEKGVSEIHISLNHRPRPSVAAYTPAGYQELQKRIQGPQINVRTIEGRLLMADFKEHGTRCRVHPSVGDPVLCLFDEEQKEEVLESILHYVKVVGEAKEDPATGRITSIRIHDIQRLEEREDEHADLLPQGTPPPTDFWQSPTIEELAQSQGIRPVQDVRTFFGTWPGEKDDGFEEDIRNLRQSNLIGGAGR